MDRQRFAFGKTPHMSDKKPKPAPNERNSAIARHLHERLDHLLQTDCRRIPLERIIRGFWWRAPLAFLIFHFLRHFPGLVDLFPKHKPRLELLDADAPPLDSVPAPIQREQR